MPFEATVAIELIKYFSAASKMGSSTFPLLPFRPYVLLKDWKPTHSLESDCVKVTSSSSKYWLSVCVQRHAAATLYKTKSSVLFCSCQRRRANTEAEWNRRVLLCGINKNVYLATVWLLVHSSGNCERCPGVGVGSPRKWGVWWKRNRSWTPSSQAAFLGLGNI